MADHNLAQAAVKANEKLAESAETLKESAVEQTDSADRRTILAANRTVLAAERTYAAWIRTGLTALASGVGVKALFGDSVSEILILPAVSALILFSAFCFVAAIWRQASPSIMPSPETRRLPMSLLVGVNGLLILVSLLALIGTWTTS
jgi:putative membrane protein